MSILNSLNGFVEYESQEGYEQLYHNPGGRYSDRTISQEFLFGFEDVVSNTSTLRRLAGIHGTYNGSSPYLTQWANSLVAANDNINTTFDNLNRAVDEIGSTISSIEEISQRLRSVSFNELPSFLLRSYLAEVDFMPFQTQQSVSQVLNNFPYFERVSESIGGVYYNVNLAPDVVHAMAALNGGDILNTISSSLLNENIFSKLPEAVTSMLDGINSNLENSFFSNTNREDFSRVFLDKVTTTISEKLGFADFIVDIPANELSFLVAELIEAEGASLLDEIKELILSELDSATNGAITAIDGILNGTLGKLEEPTAHGLNFATDMIQAKRIYDNKADVYNTLLGSFGDNIRRLDKFFPICPELKIDNRSYNIQVGKVGVIVDKLGNLIKGEFPSDTNNALGRYNEFFSYE